MQRAEKANAKARKLGIEGKLSGADIKAQYEAQEGRCFYCGAELDDHWHVDHFVPFSLSGSNTKDNIRVACGFCNDSKGTRHPDEFLRALAGDTRR
jgi:5-methylcytosine-specific restriction endonuclease McrA